MSADLHEAIEAGLRKCRVEDGSSVSLIREADLFHITHMVAAEVVDLLARVRREEGERIAQDIRAEADAKVWPKYLAARKQVDQALYQGKFDAMADAARIARGVSA